MKKKSKAKKPPKKSPIRVNRKGQISKVGLRPGDDNTLSKAQMRRILKAHPKTKVVAPAIIDLIDPKVLKTIRAFKRYLKSNAVQPKKELHMSRKSAMLALAAAMAACATAAQALASEEPDTTPEAKPEPEAKPPKAPKKAAEPETKPEEKPEPPKVPVVEKKPEPAPKAVDGAGEPITFDKLKDAFKGYAEVYGVADAKAKMLKHTPEGKKTLGDIPPEKYAEAYADFKV